MARGIYVVVVAAVVAAIIIILGRYRHHDGVLFGETFRSVCYSG